jgi:nucleoside-diphosphate-sugar epimerase
VLGLCKQENLPAVVLQPTVVYGPFSRPWTIGPVNSLRTGLVPLVDGGHGLCNAVYVDDVVDAMLLAAIRPGIEGQVMLVSGAQPISWKDFYRAFEQVLGISSTVDVSSAKLKELWKEQQRANSTWTQTRNALWNANTARLVFRNPVVRSAVPLLKRIIPEEQREVLKARLIPAKQTRSGSGRATTGTANMDDLVHVPNDTLLSMYLSRTHVRIDKAREMLGYAPKFSFDRGMRLTAQYIRWANL